MENSKSRIDKLTDKESRLLRSVEHLIARWSDSHPRHMKVQPEYDLHESILRQLNDLRDEILSDDD